MLRLARDLYYSSGFTRTILTVCLFNHLVSKLLSQKSQRVFALQSKLDRMASAFTISERICVQGPLSALYSTPFFFFNVKKNIQHSFHSKPKKNLFCTYIHSHVYFLRGWELNETQEQLFVLWYSEANLEAALNTQLTRPYLPCGIKSKLPSLLGRGGLNSAKTCAQPTSAKWSFPELVFRGRRCCVGCR